MGFRVLVHHTHTVCPNSASSLLITFPTFLTFNNQFHIQIDLNSSPENVYCVFFGI